ncbi:hypothetical protein ACGFX7_20400 [Streptomyces harbinensis]|uniref:hypothetical protein n=1 Tax=Streptomyces harbinensis TaxID=1176198 RepID=UPI00372194CA
MTAPTPLAWLHVDEFTAWVTREGTCSMCRDEHVPVMWAGSVVAYGRARTVRACAPCLRRLADFVRGDTEGPCGPTRYGTGEARPPAPPLSGATDRAFHAITVLGLAALVAGMVNTWWAGH